MICKPCREAADTGMHGLANHFAVGCKSITLSGGVPILSDPTQCDCVHRDERLVNLARVGPEMREEILNARTAESG